MLQINGEQPQVMRTCELSVHICCSTEAYERTFHPHELIVPTRSRGTHGTGQVAPLCYFLGDNNGLWKLSIFGSLRLGRPTRRGEERAGRKEGPAPVASVERVHWDCGAPACLRERRPRIRA